jgi:uncharacterized membrane protein
MSDTPQSRPDPGQYWDFPLKLALLEARIERIEHYLRFPAGAPASATPDATSTSPRSMAVPPESAAPTPAPTVPAAGPAPAPRRPVHEILAEAAARHADGMPVATPQATGTPVATTAATPGATPSPSPGTTPPSATARPPRGPAFTLEWENLIGGKWALWLGSICLFLALSYFLALAWKHLLPATRMAIGIAIGTSFLCGSGYARGRTQRWFSEGLGGVGLGILYLSVWAGATQLRVLPFSVAFMAMATVTVIGACLAVRWDALSLCALATLGGFLTPVLLRSPGSGATDTTTFLTYIAILNAGMLGVSLFKRWNVIIWISLVATMLLLGSWWLDSSPRPERWPLFAFLTIYFLLFVGTSCFYSLARREQTSPEDLLLLFSAVSAYAVSGYSLIIDTLGNAPGSFPLALALFFAAIALATWRRAPRNVTLRDSTAGLALLFATLIVPIQLRQQWIAVGWSMEAAVLLLLGARLESVLLRRAGQIVWLLAFWPLLISVSSAAIAPRVLLLNGRALPLLVSVATTWLVVADTQRRAALATAAQQKTVVLDGLESWYGAHAMLAGAWLILQETDRGFSWLMLPSAATWRVAAVFFGAALMGVYCAVAFVSGVRLRHQTMRLCAAATMALAMTLCLLAVFASPSQWLPFWNLRWSAFIVIGLATGVMGRTLARHRAVFGTDEAATVVLWPTILSLFVLAGIAAETYFSFAYWQGARAGYSLENAAVINEHWQFGAFCTIALIMAIYSTGMLYLGCLYRDYPLRATAYWIAGGAVLLLLSMAVQTAGIAWRPWFNLRVLSFSGVTASLIVAVNILKQFRDRLTADEAGYASLAALTAALLPLWSLTQETHETYRTFAALLTVDWHSAALFMETILWHGYALGLLALGLRYRDGRYDGQPYRVAAYIIGVLAGSALLLGATFTWDTGWRPIFNIRFAAFLLATLLDGVAALWLRRSRSTLKREENSIASGIGAVAALLLWFGLIEEIHELCRHFLAGSVPAWGIFATFCMAILSSGYALGLLRLSLRRNWPLFRVLAYGVGIVGCDILLTAGLEATQLNWTPLMNVRLLAYVATTAGLGLAASWLRHDGAVGEQERTFIAPLLALGAAAVLLIGLTQEAYATCYYYQEALGTFWNRWGQMSISVVWSVYGALLLIGGIHRGYQPVRLIGLGLLGVTLIKVFLFDLSFLDGPMRILSLTGLGLSLIFISWLYSRYGPGVSLPNRSSVAGR